MAIEIKTNIITAFEHGLRVRLVEADDVPAAGTFLSAQERVKYESFKIEKRRHDWLGGRYAAKTLIAGDTEPRKALAEIEISYDSFGRPICGSGSTTRLISITHSGPFRAAACGPESINFIGIDIEKSEPRDPAWYKDYFHESELTAAAASISSSHIPHPSQHATRLWTAKEALLKALGLGLKADPLDINLSGAAPEFRRAALSRYEEMGRPPFTLLTLRHGPEYFISLASQTNGAK